MKAWELGKQWGKPLTRQTRELSQVKSESERFLLPYKVNDCTSQKSIDF